MKKTFTRFPVNSFCWILMCGQNGICLLRVPFLGQCLPLKVQAVRQNMPGWGCKRCPFLRRSGLRGCRMSANQGRLGQKGATRITLAQTAYPLEKRWQKWQRREHIQQSLWPRRLQPVDAENANAALYATEQPIMPCENDKNPFLKTLLNW